MSSQVDAYNTIAGMNQMRVLMGSSWGWHLDFSPWSPVSLPPVREAGSYRLPALELRESKLLTSLVSIEIPVLFPTQEQNIFGWFDGFTIGYMGVEIKITTSIKSNAAKM